MQGPVDLRCVDDSGDAKSPDHPARPQKRQRMTLLVQPSDQVKQSNILHGWKEDPRSRDDKGIGLYKKVLHSLDLTLLWVCGCMDVACMFLFFGRL